MSSLDQYLDLWRNHAPLVESHAPEALNRLRGKAFESLLKKGLPRAGSADYPFTDLEALLAPDFGLNLARVPMDADPAASFRCEVPRLSTSLWFLVNDAFASSAAAEAGLPDGVEVRSLAWLAAHEPEWVETHYGQLASLDDPLVALDTLFCQDGFVLRVRKGVKVEKTIQLVEILNSLTPYMAVRRLLIVLEEDAEARLLVCDHGQTDECLLAALRVVEVFAGKRSRFSYYDLEENSSKTTRLSSLWLRQEEDSEVLLDSVTLFNGTTRNEFHTCYQGRGASLKLLGMGIEDGDRRLENWSRIEHRAQDCHTDELFKYVVDDRARGSFVGRIVVAEGATGTEAYQSNRNLLGSDQARMHSKPELEIYNDDVKCSHGSATGQLDPMQLFYMRTRGLSESEARLLLKQAFMADVIDAIDLPALSERLRHLVEMRFSGALTSACGNCRLNC